jgi:hypothetical protein
MPDAVLPILGFVFGSVGFLTTVRNGVTLILNDRDSFGRFGNDLVPLLCEVTSLSRRIERWRKLWKIHDGAPWELIRVYWGVQGGQRMLALLARTELTCREIEKEFESRYGEARYEAETGPGVLSEQELLSSEANEARLDNHTRRWKRKFGVGGHTSNALLQGPLFRKHLDFLGNCVSRLEGDAILEFIQEWDCDENKAKNYATRVGTKFLLTRLATNSARTTEALLELLSPVNNFGVDFQVGNWHQAVAEYRDEALASCAGRGSFAYYFRIRRTAPTPDVLKLTIDAVTSRNEQSLLSSFEHGVLAWGPNPQNAVMYMRPESHRATFKVTQVEGSVQDPEILRVLFSSSQSEDFMNSLHSDFSRRDRIKLAYELAESVLIFMKTTWYSQLCSCAVHRICIDEVEEEYEYYFRINNTRHFEPGTGEIGPTKQWCEEELIHMHIYRLGVLLVEIALGKAVAEVACDHATNRLEIDLGEGTAAHPQDLPPRKVARRVEKAAGEDFSMAVKYCLSHGKRPEAIGPKDLGRFFNEVVAP